MKTTAELNALKAEVENIKKKLAVLTREELEQVYGGDWPAIDPQSVKYRVCCTNKECWSYNKEFNLKSNDLRCPGCGEYMRVVKSLF